MKQSDKPYILLVEDSLSLGRVYQEYLKELDVEIEHVTDGQTALDVLKDRAVDIVLLDLNLPDMHGLDILTYLHESAPHVSSIVITAHGSVDMAVEAIQLGAYDLIEYGHQKATITTCIKNVEMILIKLRSHFPKAEIVLPFYIPNILSSCLCNILPLKRSRV